MAVNILMKHEFTPKIVEKYSNIKFQENSFSGSRTDGRTDMKLVASFRNFAKAPKIESQAPIRL